MSTAGKIRALWSFVWTSWRMNLAGAMEFRLSFLLTAGTMFVNNAVWLFFWGLFFGRFKAVNGWVMDDIFLLWAVSAGGFGLMAVFFGNAPRISPMVAQGDLDAYLVQPKPLLLNILVSRMDISAIGDLLFGLVIYSMFGEWSLAGWLKFLLSMVITMLIFLSMAVILNTLAFFIGNADGISFQLFNGLLAFSQYPTDIFKGAAKVILFTILPAGFISYLPIKLLRQVDLPFLAVTLAVSAAITGCAILLFRLGLKRYTSGNRMGMRT
ncbi:ABC transporter permease [Gorillibacterium massiliense]|uniref:ABC transporter permease n=1 Tax=Gorillibacterium massiliense TaxID=1280390 RepID=UPI000593E566|nr:ABC-2 family transporter protein [Gorillibacterium massiliense]